MPAAPASLTRSGTPAPLLRACTTATAARTGPRASALRAATGCPGRFAVAQCADRQGRQFLDCLRQVQRLLLADVLREHTGEIAVGARVVIGLEKHALRRRRLLVRIGARRPIRWTWPVPTRWERAAAQRRWRSSNFPPGGADVRLRAILRARSSPSFRAWRAYDTMQETSPIDEAGAREPSVSRSVLRRRKSRRWRTRTAERRRSGHSWQQCCSARCCPIAPLAGLLPNVNSAATFAVSEYGQCPIPLRPDLIYDR